MRPVDLWVMALTVAAVILSWLANSLLVALAGTLFLVAFTPNAVRRGRDRRQSG